MFESETKTNNIKSLKKHAYDFNFKNCDPIDNQQNIKLQSKNDYLG
jgi:hypothetical protein